MTKSSGVQLMKALTQKGLTQEEKRRLILGNEISARQPKLDELMLTLENKRGLIIDWHCQGALFKKFMAIIASLTQVTVSNDTSVQQRHIKDIEDIRKLISNNCARDKTSASFIVLHFIDTQLREIETQLKVVLVQQWASAKANG